MPDLIGQFLERYLILEHVSTLRRGSGQASLNTSLGEGKITTDSWNLTD